MGCIAVSSGMPSSRMKAILEVLSSGIDPEAARGVLKVFGASSIEECVSIYESVGAAERSALDEAVARVAPNLSATFLQSVEPDGARGEDPYSDLTEEVARFAADDVEPQSDPRMQTYRVRRQLISLGRSYWVEDAAGARIFKVAGRIGFARKFSIKDASGNRLYSVREKLLVLSETYIIHRDDLEVAVVTRTTTSGAPQHKFEIVLQSGETLRASGLLWHDDGIQIVRDNTRIGIIRRQRNVLRETFWATLHRSEEQALLLAIAMSIVETDLTRGNA